MEGRHTKSTFFYEQAFVKHLHYNYPSRWNAHAFCDVVVDKVSSIDMKSSTTKLVLELKAELKLICYSNETREMWTNYFDAHNAGDIVNPITEEKYSVKKDGEVRLILREFSWPLQGLIDSKLHCSPMNLFGNMFQRKLPYSELFWSGQCRAPSTSRIGVSIIRWRPTPWGSWDFFKKIPLWP